MTKQSGYATKQTGYFWTKQLGLNNQASRTGWVSPLTREDKEYFAYLRQVSKRYNIDMSKANRLEYNFVIRVAESEFYAHHTS